MLMLGCTHRMEAAWFSVAAIVSVAASLRCVFDTVSNHRRKIAGKNHLQFMRSASGTRRSPQSFPWQEEGIRSGLLLPPGGYRAAIKLVLGLTGPKLFISNRKFAFKQRLFHSRSGSIRAQTLIFSESPLRTVKVLLYRRRTGPQKGASVGACSKFKRQYIHRGR